MYFAQILADSISPDGVRLTTMEVEYPHAIHKDIMTHRMFSRNFQSFRAFPPEQVIENIIVDPFIPETFDYRVKGMGQGDNLDGQESMKARAIWMEHIRHSIQTARQMMELNLAKAQVNFVLQDLTFIRGIITATEWDNFWNLRCAINPQTGKSMARPEVFKIAMMMKGAYDTSTPQLLHEGQWHMPLVFPINLIDNPDTWDRLKKISPGRCARVSYLTHDGVRNPAKDVDLHDRLQNDKHMSPFENVARPIPLTGSKWVPEIHPVTRKATGLMLPGPDWRANFYGWQSYRMDVEEQRW